MFKETAPDTPHCLTDEYDSPTETLERVKLLMRELEILSRKKFATSRSRHFAIFTFDEFDLLCDIFDLSPENSTLTLELAHGDWLMTTEGYVNYGVGVESGPQTTTEAHAA